MLVGERPERTWAELAAAVARRAGGLRDRHGVEPGDAVAPIDGEVMERIMSADNAARVTASPPEQPTLEELRARHGTKPGEDDLLILKALIPESDIEAMQAAGPVARDYPLLPPEIEEIRSLIKTVQSPYVRVSGERWALDLKR